MSSTQVDYCELFKILESTDLHLLTPSLQGSSPVTLNVLSTFHNVLLSRLYYCMFFMAPTLECFYPSLVSCDDLVQPEYRPSEDPEENLDPGVSHGEATRNQPDIKRCLSDGSLLWSAGDAFLWCVISDLDKVSKYLT